MKKKALCRLPFKKRKFDFIKKYWTLCSKEGEQINTYEVQICNVVAWTGMLVVTIVVLRSLYLMYLKPDGT
jgi:hypothetical protein